MHDVARSRSKEKQSSFLRLLKEMQISLFFLVFGLFLIRLFYYYFGFCSSISSFMKHYIILHREEITTSKLLFSNIIIIK